MMYLALGLLALVVVVLVARGRNDKVAQPLRSDAAKAIPPNPYSSTAATDAPAQRQAASASSPASPAATPPAMRAPVRTWPPQSAPQLPAELASLQLTPLQALAAPQREALVGRLKTIPRPPHAMDKLVSAEFLSSASSAEINDLMVGEPQIAAKVLATVNSPLYGLKSPLASIGQAATYLGMNKVRGICLQYMLDATFRATSPEVKAFYQRLWNASAFSSELCFKLAQLLRLPDPGALVTHVVLSNVGPLGAYGLLEGDAVQQLARSTPIERVRAEQDALGLCAAEVGKLLMQTWEVPASVIDDVRAIDLVLVQRCSTPDAHSARVGLCYLCNRIGEMLATGALSDLQSFDPLAIGSAETYFLPSYLQHASLARLPEFLQFPEVVAAVNQMASAVRLSRSGL